MGLGGSMEVLDGKLGVVVCWCFGFGSWISVRSMVPDEFVNFVNILPCAKSDPSHISSIQVKYIT